MRLCMDWWPITIKNIKIWLLKIMKLFDASSLVGTVATTMQHVESFSSLQSLMFQIYIVLVTHWSTTTTTSQCNVFQSWGNDWFNIYTCSGFYLRNLQKYFDYSLQLLEASDLDRIAKIRNAHKQWNYLIWVQCMILGQNRSQLRSCWRGFPGASFGGSKT